MLAQLILKYPYIHKMTLTPEYPTSLDTFLFLLMVAFIFTCNNYIRVYPQ